jgi:RNA polymerase sigma factor (TIGR02999 family)
MRHILVDHARSHRAYKRGGLQRQVTLDDTIPAAPGCTIDVLALNEALDHLAQFDPRQARVLELHYFGGLTFEEISSVLDVAVRSVKRDSRIARDWLKGELSK